MGRWIGRQRHRPGPRNPWVDAQRRPGGRWLEFNGRRCPDKDGIGCRAVGDSRHVRPPKPRKDLTSATTCVSPWNPREAHSAASGISRRSPPARPDTIASITGGQTAFPSSLIRSRREPPSRRYPGSTRGRRTRPTCPPKLRIGSLLAQGDVEVSLSARQVVSRHLAILAMTGGGKTVAARRIIRELIGIGYPLVIFDPHGDYLGLFEKRALFPNTAVRILYPAIRVRNDNVGVVAELIGKMGRKLTDAQQQFFHLMLGAVEVVDGELASTYI